MHTSQSPNSRAQSPQPAKIPQVNQEETSFYSQTRKDTLRNIMRRWRIISPITTATSLGAPFYPGYIAHINVLPEEHSHVFFFRTFLQSNKPFQCYKGPNSGIKSPTTQNQPDQYCVRVSSPVFHSPPQYLSILSASQFIKSHSQLLIPVKPQNLIS